MRQCERCHSYSSDDQYCSNCGNRFAAGQTLNSATTTPIPGPPPEVPRKRKASTSIPGLGAFGLLRRDPHTGKLGCGPGCLISTILVAMLAALGGFLVLHQPHLTVSNVIPGGSMQVHGSNFPPDSTVGITVDGSPAASHSTNVFASVGGIVLWGRQIRPSDHTVAVKSDGTFDTTVSVPSSWTSGSHHTIQATTQNAQASTQASIDVETQSSGQPSTVPPTATPTPTPTPTATTTPISVPGISKISPPSGPAGTPIIITGSGFTKAISVSFGLASVRCGVDNTCTVDSDTQITVVIPAENPSDASASVPVDVTVTTPNGTSTKSNTDLFTYTASPPPAQPPVVSSLDQTSGPAAGGTTVTISGTGFTGATSVAFGSASVNCPSDSGCKINSDGTQITVTSPAESSSDSPGKPVDVRVTTHNGTSQTSSADLFTYTAPPQPPVMQLSTNSLTFGPLGCNKSQSQQITITNGGGGTLTWTVDTSSQPSWLTMTPTNGSAPGTLKFTATTGLSNTSDNTTVKITGSDGTTQTVTVTLTVQCVG